MLARTGLRRLTARLFSKIQVNHTPDPHNTSSHVFNFTPDNEQQVADILSRYPGNYKKSAMIPLLFLAQEQNDNLLTLGAMEKIAEVLEVPYMDVYEVATFYSMFNRTPVGKFHLQVCRTTPCMVCGSDEIVKAIEQHLGIHVGETTKDKMFTLVEVECLGACVNAPMLQINNAWVYEDLTPENVVRLIDDLRAGKEVNVGPQNHRKNSEGPHGRTSLHDIEAVQEKAPVYDRDFTKAKEEWQKAKEAAANAKK